MCVKGGKMGGRGHRPPPPPAVGALCRRSPLMPAWSPQVKVSEGTMALLCLLLVLLGPSFFGAARALPPAMPRAALGLPFPPGSAGCWLQAAVGRALLP